MYHTPFALSMIYMTKNGNCPSNWTVHSDNIDYFKFSSLFFIIVSMQLLYFLTVVCYFLTAGRQWLSLRQISNHCKFYFTCLFPLFTFKMRINNYNDTYYNYAKKRTHTVDENIS